MCLPSAVMGEDREDAGKLKNGLIRDDRLSENVHVGKIPKGKSKFNNMKLSKSNSDQTEIRNENNNNKVTSNAQMDEDVKCNRVDESCLLRDGEIYRVSHQVKRMVLNGGVSSVQEEAENLRSRALDPEKLTIRGRSFTPTRLRHEKKHHLPTWDIIDTDKDRYIYTTLISFIHFMSNTMTVSCRRKDRKLVLIFSCIHCCDL